jgi:hypothetical protein
MSYTYIDLWCLLTYALLFNLYKYISKYLSNEKTFIHSVTVDDLQYVKDRDFSTLSQEEFDDLFRYAHKRNIKTKDKVITVQNTKFDTIYYFAVIPKTAVVSIKYKDTLISYVKEGAWLGSVEFISSYQQENSKWAIDVEIKNNDTEIIYYEWDRYVNRYF